MHDAPEHLDDEEKLLWKNADGFARSLLRRISIARAETKQARDWAEKTVQEIAEVRVLTCVYCGHQYPDGTPAAKHAALTEHIQTCEKHPMTELRNRVASFCDLMAEALGAEPLAPEDHDLDILAETLLVRLEAQNREDDKAIAIQKAASELLAALVVHQTPAAGSPVDLAAKKLNDLVRVF